MSPLQLVLAQIPDLSLYCAQAMSGMTTSEGAFLRRPRHMPRTPAFYPQRTVIPTIRFGRRTNRGVGIWASELSLDGDELFPRLSFGISPENWTFYTTNSIE